MIIGITGTNAAGKDTVVDLLKGKYGFRNYSLSDEIKYELVKRGLDYTRDNLIVTGNDLREKFGPGELAFRAIKRAENDKPENILFTSIRNPAEISGLKKIFPDFKLIFIDAPIEMRYERAKKRGSAGKIGEAEYSFEQFKEKEDRELRGGKNEQQLLTCRDLADIKVMNAGTIEELQRKIETVLNLK